MENSTYGQLKGFLQGDAEQYLPLGKETTMGSPVERMGLDRSPMLTVEFTSPAIEQVHRDLGENYQVSELVDFTLKKDGVVHVQSYFTDERAEYLREADMLPYTETFDSVDGMISHFQSAAAEGVTDNNPCRIARTSVLARFQAEANNEFKNGPGFSPE